LREVFLKVLFAGFLGDTTNKDLGGALLFITRNSTLGVNLFIVLGDCCILGYLEMEIELNHVRQREEDTYNFAIQIMFLHHHNIDRAGILECEKAEAS
jgi:hypothetical protein